MVREVNLLEHLPPFMQEYIEMQQIMFAENPDVQLLENRQEVVKNNQFILTCDETGISMFEKLLSIIPSVNDTLEERKTRVITKWNDSLPYTYKGLIKALNVLCGEGGYQISTNFNEYRLYLVVSLSHVSLKQLDEIIIDMIPANINVTYLNELPENIPCGLYVGKTIQTVKHITIN